MYTNRVPNSNLELQKELLVIGKHLGMDRENSEGLVNQARGSLLHRCFHPT